MNLLVTCVFPHYLQDELLWASAWLYRATKDSKYLDFLQDNQGGSSTEFSWDNKYPGVQMLATQVSHTTLHIPVDHPVTSTSERHGASMSLLF